MTGFTNDALKALRRHRWAIFAVLTIGYFFVYFHRISVSVVGQDIVADVGGSIGILSSVYYWTYTAMQIPSGVMADRFGPRVAATVFLLIASIGSLITCVGTEFWMIVLGKVMIAAGMAIVYVPLMKLVSVWFPKADFAVLSGIVIAVGNVGAIAATGPLELLADALGWREVFLVLGLITLILAVLCAVAVMPLEYKLGALLLLAARYVTVFVEVRRIAQRLGEERLMSRYFIYDLLSPLWALALGVMLLRRDDRVWR